MLSRIGRSFRVASGMRSLGIQLVVYKRSMERSGTKAENNQAKPKLDSSGVIQINEKNRKSI